MGADRPPRALLTAALRQLSLPVDLAQPLLAYRDLLVRWNRVYNLSAVRDPAEMIPRHLLDSLVVRPWLPVGTLLDVGTGPGLPGIPLAMADPDRPITLLESNGKKVRFLRQACLELQLGNVQVVHDRLENHAPESGYDAVICRAFTDAAAFWRGVSHLLRPGAPALAMKGRRQPAELAGLKEDGVSCRWQTLDVPGLDAERQLLIMRNSP
ncbi:16S rRNA (guanine(527)-N(7))-methyltransferase RsmG [Spiribacter sp. 2438]|uniref:16S rRNA (guanine(527)-N(7))-methyltransferase RsmG n=1 Tax=Spiribacter sp. 2438 TaxID=2666185 RepID=UPI0012B001AE|nr:16S rRNA (guanine(527)-N(7))-methyltransferase RsmG [Spiribacter sp. 2438]QGM22457.1 16S rRNA (guanine(527)-N(7))-methyltransferase RsmG [Spiribacter sp. 2438]